LLGASGAGAGMVLLGASGAGAGMVLLGAAGAGAGMVLLGACGAGVLFSGAAGAGAGSLLVGACAAGALLPGACDVCAWADDIKAPARIPAPIHPDSRLKLMDSVSQIGGTTRSNPTAEKRTRTPTGHWITAL
jgi:hypothetical protein